MKWSDMCEKVIKTIKHRYGGDKPTWKWYNSTVTQINYFLGYNDLNLIVN